MQSPQAITQPIIAGQSCPLCGGAGQPVGIAQGYKLRECQCEGRVLLSWQWRSEEEYENYYTDDSLYHVHAQADRGMPSFIERDGEYSRAAEARLEQLEVFVDSRTATVLDVGAAGGSFVLQAYIYGWNAQGIEPNKTIAEWARNQGRDLACGGWQDVGPQWDVITMHDVLEHVTRPLDCLTHLRECLAPGGLLVVEWPEWGCPQAQGTQLGFRHIKPLEHIALYDDRAARALFDRAGLEVEAAIRPRRMALGKIAYYLSAKDS